MSIRRGRPYLKPGFFILRAYLEEWAWEVGRLFAGVGAGASDADLAHIAARHPVFRILP